MSWFMAKIYDGFMEESERACLGDWRRALLERAEGDVLEVGAGTGANLPYYPNAVKRLVVSEPDRHMRAKLEDKARAESRLEVTDATLGELRLDAGSFDVVVCTLVLCSVADQNAALADALRVLRPGGSLLFIEHVAATDNPKRLAWQRRIEPVWRLVSGNCHLTRDTGAAIAAAGFEPETLKRESMRKALPWVRPTIRGVARKP